MELLLVPSEWLHTEHDCTIVPNVEREILKETSKRILARSANLPIRLLFCRCVICRRPIISGSTGPIFAISAQMVGIRY